MMKNLLLFRIKKRKIFNVQWWIYNNSNNNNQNCRFLYKNNSNNNLDFYNLMENNAIGKLWKNKKE